MGTASQVIFSFFDTNVLVYLYDANEPYKQDKAHSVFWNEVSQGSAIISTQVLQEFYNTVTTKLAEPLDKNTAELAVSKFTQITVRPVNTQIIISAIKRNQNDPVSFWDSLIIETALAAGARILWSEDMQHDREFDGLKIQNPFK